MRADSRTTPDIGFQAALTAGLVDDAAVFPPGSATLPDAVTWHGEYRSSWYAGMVGPLVLPGTAAQSLRALVSPAGPPLRVCFTFPAGPGTIAETLAVTPSLVEVGAVEVAVPPGETVAGFVPRITAALGGRAIETAVEIPRDGRRDAVLAEVASSGARAKLRTGGDRRELYPTEVELATTLLAVLAAGVSFKATAGLHHALRNTDPNTGFEQHGFLNLLLAAEAGAGGASRDDLVSLLAERSAERIAALVQQLGTAGVERARGLFTSFGSCSVIDPLSDLMGLGLLVSMEGKDS